MDHLCDRMSIVEMSITQRFRRNLIPSKSLGRLIDQLQSEHPPKPGLQLLSDHELIIKLDFQPFVPRKILKYNVSLIDQANQSSIKITSTKNPTCNKKSQISVYEFRRTKSFKWTMNIGNQDLLRWVAIVLHHSGPILRRGELETSTATTLINLSYEATKESIHYLVSATFPFKNQIKIPEKLIEGENGHHTDGTSLSRKRKANEIDDECECDIGIVAEKWYFMEWTLDSEGKPSFKLSKILSVRCGYEERHDGKNPWSYYLEAHKPLEASQSREQSREITRIRSLSNRAKNSNFMYHAFFCIYF
ncbi:hypothetical protein GLOIN_2v1785755 [Rhizophagus irregularis DAOM 181602=DAOM 197198]|nr:hypothetical protein GLOIN_2v1785755 [Rhizophagus irregularis DAOM 181602=DAOM 197198]